MSVYVIGSNYFATKEKLYYTVFVIYTASKRHQCFPAVCEVFRLNGAKYFLVDSVVSVLSPIVTRLSNKCT